MKPGGQADVSLHGGRRRMRDHAGTRRSSGRSGFTLVEVVVTLVILSVMAAVAVPAFRSSRELGDLDLAAERVRLLLRIARDSAVKTAQPVTVVVDSTTSLVWITTPSSTGMDGNSESLLAAGVTTVPTGPGSSLDLPASVRMQLTSSRARFVFQPGGTVFADSIYLTSTAGGRLVTLNRGTGHAIIY